MSKPGLGKSQRKPVVQELWGSVSLIYDATIGEFITDLGAMPLNCLIFQDDIAKLNKTLEQARTGAKLIRETLAKKRDLLPECQP